MLDYCELGNPIVDSIELVADVIQQYPTARIVHIRQLTSQGPSIIIIILQKQKHKNKIFIIY